MVCLWKCCVSIRNISKLSSDLKILTVCERFGNVKCEIRTSLGISSHFLLLFIITVLAASSERTHGPQSLSVSLFK